MILIRVILKLLIYISINTSYSLLGVKLYTTLFSNLPPLDEVFNIAYTFSNNFD